MHWKSCNFSYDTKTTPASNLNDGLMYAKESTKIYKYKGSDFSRLKSLTFKTSSCWPNILGKLRVNITENWQLGRLLTGLLSAVESAVSNGFKEISNQKNKVWKWSKRHWIGNKICVTNSSCQLLSQLISAIQRFSCKINSLKFVVNCSKLTKEVKISQMNQRNGAFTN